MAFDPFWEETSLSRSEAYRLLAAELRVPKAYCHIALFNIELCKRVAQLRWPFAIPDTMLNVAYIERLYEDTKNKNLARLKRDMYHR